MISLKVIARLLDYPEQVLFDHQQALIEALEPASELDLHHSAQLILFIRRLCARPLLDVQADYCELFDRGRATSLLLFEHVHGESRDRGQAMVDLMAQYRAAGLEIDSRELPDFLPLYLEYLASRSAARRAAGHRADPGRAPATARKPVCGAVRSAAGVVRQRGAGTGAGAPGGARGARRYAAGVGCGVGRGAGQVRRTGLRLRPADGAPAALRRRGGTTVSGPDGCVNRNQRTLIMQF